MSRLLSALRGDRTQAEVARLAGLTQIKVSRAERGLHPLSPEEADQFARALGAAEADRARLVELAHIKAADHITSRAVLSRSGAAIQERIERLERDADLIRSWQPELIIGPLQTEAYTAAMLGVDPGPDWLAARAARRAVFADPSRTWHQIMSEGALRWMLGSAELMADQIEHLLVASERKNVKLGIIDQATPKPIAAPAPFHLIGDTAMVATDVGTSFLTDPRDRERLEELFSTLDQLALYGRDAQDLLREIRDHYRAQPATRPTS